MSVVLRGGTALWGRSLDPVETEIHIIDGEIQRTGGAVEIDARGLFLLPGFIDAHVHIGFFEPWAVLMGGVTTVRDLGWPEDEIFPLASRSQDDLFDGPEILATGPLLTVEGGYPTRAAWAPPGTGSVVDNADDTGEIVARLKKRGACAIKVALNKDVGPTLDLATLRAIVNAAHSAGLRVTAHINGLDELDKALDAGVDELAHMLMAEERIPDETIERMVRQEVAIVPTLSCRFGSDLQVAIENLQRFLAAGGRAIYGTDLGNEGPRPGIDATEIAAMTAAGMTAMDVIRSATIESAAYLGLEDRGYLEVGMRGDVIGFRSDPRTDASVLAEVALVVRRGRVIKES